MTHSTITIYKVQTSEGCGVCPLERNGFCLLVQDHMAEVPDQGIRPDCPISNGRSVHVQAMTADEDPC